MTMNLFLIISINLPSIMKSHLIKLINYYGSFAPVIFIWTIQNDQVPDWQNSKSKLSFLPLKKNCAQRRMITNFKMKIQLLVLKTLIPRIYVARVEEN